MVENVKTIDNKLGEKIALDELFDYLLYKKLAGITNGDLKQLFEELIPIEQNHFHFWQEFFHIKPQKLNLARKIKLWILFSICWLFKEKATHLVLESIEIYGTRKYLMIWDQYKNEPLGEAVREVLNDELKHEDIMVSRFIERRVNAEKIRDIFLGLNDGLVEILGAVSGFFAAFSNSGSVLIAGFTVAVAGSISMAAGIFVASGSEKEIEMSERRKSQFFNKVVQKTHKHDSAMRNAVLVGVSYLIGAMIPILPVLIGAKSVFISIIASGAIIVFVSFFVAFISGMNIKRRVITNVVIIAMAVVVTYTMGIIVREIWGIRI
ncbi:MAG: VIT1/CCC1 transporter family protein [Patescibacteria group bacterium]